MLTNLKKKLRHNKTFWKYVMNYKPTMAYHKPAQADPVASRIVNELNKNGVAFSNIDEIFDDKALYEELMKAVDQLEHDNAEMIETSRKNVNNIKDDSDKTFMLFLLGQDPVFDKNSIWARVALQNKFQQIADAYFEMKDAEMRYYNVWHNIPYHGEPRNSQLWHRDREDLQILKIFIYFTDIDEKTGPFTYAPGTHIKGPVQQIPAYHLENGVQRTNDEQMAAVVPQKNWITGICKKGTIAFADTHGYHKGGHVQDKDRLLFTIMYVSPACQRKLFAN